jgi:4-hydroxybenzoate polyprenyltransferase
VSERLLGLARLVHPFPSILDGLATAAIAIVAGGGPAVALRLGVAMTAIQFAIGALNDLADAERDAGRPDKPIPSGQVGRRLARLVVVTGFAVGLGLSAPAGPLVLGLALAGAAAGVAYDLGLKGTPWAPVAFAIGLPLLAVYAWLGASGELPPGATILVPAASLAGIALAVGNALVDVERDRASGTLTPATELGPARAWTLAAALYGVVIGLALGSIALASPPAGPGGAAAGPGAAATALGSIGIVAGLALARSRSASRRERGWELQAVGVAALGAGWLLAVAGPSGLL